MKLKTISVLILLAASSSTFAVSTASLERDSVEAERVVSSVKELSGKAIFEKASKLYESSADSKERSKAYLLALEGAKKNNADSQLLLSLMYEVGQGVDVDVDEAEKWRQLAAKSGHIDAKGIIAIMGIAQDLDKEGVKELKPLADAAYKSGSIFGLAAMAYVVHDGYGVEPDEEKGKALLLKAMSKPIAELNFFERIYLEDIQSLVLEIE